MTAGAKQPEAYTLSIDSQTYDTFYQVRKLGAEMEIKPLNLDKMSREL